MNPQTLTDTNSAEQALEANIKKLENTGEALAEKISEGTVVIRELSQAAILPVRLLASLRRIPLPVIGTVLTVCVFYLMGRNFRTDPTALHELN